MKLASIMIVASALIACGGGDDDGPPPPVDGGTTGMDGGPGDGGQPFTCTPTGGETRFYVMNALDIPAEVTAGVVPGFNLDGVDSQSSNPEAWAAGCMQPDKRSPPPDSEMGVDNQLGPILTSLGSSFDIAGTIAENLADGSLLLLAEVVGVDDTMDDDCVALNLYIGERTLAPAPAGSTCMAGEIDTDGVCGPCAADMDCAADATQVCDDMTCESTPMLDGAGLIAPGQTIDINMASIMAGEPIISVPARIVSGRLRAGPVDITLNIPVGDIALELNIRMAQVRFTFAGDNIEQGVLGGALNVDEVITTITSIPEFMDFAGTAMTILREQADLYPDSSGECQSVSVSLTLEGVPAVRGEVR